MRAQNHNFLQLSILPAREMTRAPIVLLLTTTTILTTLIIPLVLAFQFGDTGKRLVRDGGLALQVTAGILLVSSAACSLIRRERESGVTAMLLTKPVSRHWYLLSRFAGISMVALLFSATTCLATMLAHRAAESFEIEIGYKTDALAALSGIACIPFACATGAWLNWRRNSSFHAVTLLALPVYLALACLFAGTYTRAGALAATFNPQLDPHIIIAAASLAMLLLVFTALALSLGAWLPPVSTAGIALIVLFAGFASPALLVRNAPFSVLFAALPNWNWFWIAEQLDSGNASILTASIFPLLYGTLLTTAILCVGMITIDKAEVPA